MSNTILSCENLTHRYNAADALHDVHFQIDKGEMVYLTGHSGAGKSTLLQLIALFLKPSSGEIYFNNTCLSTLSFTERALYRRQLGVITQTPQLLLNQSIFDSR